MTGSGGATDTGGAASGDPEWALTPVPDSATAYCIDATAGIPCSDPSAVPGQDGLVLGPASTFTAVTGLGLTAVHDLITDLIWLDQIPDDGVELKRWAEANTYCASLNSSHAIGGRTWRLPTIVELMMLGDYGRMTVWPTTMAYRPTTYAWSATAIAFAASHFHWALNRSGANATSVSDTVDALAVRCVAASASLLSNASPGAPASQYDPYDAASTTIHDRRTGMTWQRNAAGCPGCTWAQALAYCDSLSLATFSDWRLPTVKELATIVDYRATSPAVDVNAFPGTATADSYWTSTAVSGFSNKAWLVQMRGYLANGVDPTGVAHARCVR
jgi:hypothetical protein